MKLDINVKELENLMKNFYVLTGIRIVLFDTNGNNIYSYPGYDCQYCQRMKAKPDTCKLCRLSDQASFAKCREKGELIIYHCHAGLIEATAPLIDHGTVIGYMMFGQIADRKNEAHIPVKTSEQIEAAAKIMEACTFYVIFKDAVRVSRDNFIANMDQYLRDHLSCDLSVQNITKELGISKTKLYNTCNLYYGHSIAQHIRLLRIEEAKRLLTTTDYTVSEISDMVGFEDYNYFCRVFKSIVGMPAKKYRQL